jgi:hypothetical protein
MAVTVAQVVATIDAQVTGQDKVDALLTIIYALVYSELLTS